MGGYLDSKTAYILYKNETNKPFIVDKSRMLKELFPLVQDGNNHICITRPRRFGKTIAANMITSFFSKAWGAGDVFQGLQIAQAGDYEKYLNQYSVIHISFNDTSGQCKSYSQYIQRMTQPGLFLLWMSGTIFFTRTLSLMRIKEPMYSF